MTRYEAYIDKRWREHGLAQVVVVRRRDNGLVDFGVFQVDLWCLGVRDAEGATDVPPETLDEFLEEELVETQRESIHPACAKTLIEGAVAYAERLGFAPHRDFRKARRALSGVDAALCPTEFTYGHDGRPRYVPDENDSEERIERVLAILEARVGPDGFDYEEIDYENGIAALRDDLKEWLDAEPAGVPRFYAVSGMITAALICPNEVSFNELMQDLWANVDERVWADADELQEFADLFKDYWNYLATRVRASAASKTEAEAQPIDIWPEELPEDDPLPIAAASVEWASGFLRVTEVWPEAWADALQRPELAPHWEVLRWWADFTDEDNRNRIADAAEATPSRTLTKSVVALTRALRPMWAT